MTRVNYNLAHDAPMLTRKPFTLAEADRSLVLVRRVVADIVQHYTRLVDLQESIDAAQASGAYEQCETSQRQLVEVAQRLQAFAEELDVVGVELRDWITGVVDFPCMIDGREACFCWRLGEDHVEYWHEVGSETETRQSVSDLAAHPV